MTGAGCDDFGSSGLAVRGALHRAVSTGLQAFLVPGSVVAQRLRAAVDRPLQGCMEMTRSDLIERLALAF